MAEGDSDPCDISLFGGPYLVPPISGDLGECSAAFFGGPHVLLTSEGGGTGGGGEGGIMAVIIS